MMEELKKLPKVELHLHLDGSVLLDTAVKLSGLSEKKLREQMIAPPKCLDLGDYLTKFSFPISLMQTKTNLERIAIELTKELEKENVIYAEIRFAPMFHVKEDLSFEEVVTAVLKGLRTNSKVKTNLILCLMRGMSDEENWQTIDVASKFLSKGVVGIDLAGDEAKYPLANYVKFFQKAKELHIPFTIHAGEVGSYSEVEEAIEIGAKRIGHGIAAVKSQDTINLIKEKSILLEICPTSNVQTNAISSYADNPILKFYQNKVLTSINTDNRTVSDIDLTREYLKLQQNFNFTIDDFKVMNINAINKAFISDMEKEQLREIIKNS